MGAGRRIDGAKQGHIGRGGRPRRRQPVGGQPGVHARGVGLAQDRREGAQSGHRAGLPAQCARARHGVRAVSRIIGLVVAYLDNQFYPDALEKLSNALQAQGYHVLVFMASQKAGNIDTVVEEILDYQVDGIIAASVSLSSDLTARCRAAGVPMVLFNRSQDDPQLLAVTSDNVAGGRAVADFLLAGGHRRIGYIAGWEGASTQRDREAGFRAGWPRRVRRCMPARSAISAWTRRAEARGMFAARSPRCGLRRQRPHGDGGDGHAAPRAGPARARRCLGRGL
jgi:hypothetical protein